MILFINTYFVILFVFISFHETLNNCTFCNYVCSQFPTAKDEWKKIGKGFEDRWQFVNCGGAIDGKHIRIVPPPNSGAYFYNYKNYYSIVLMALVNWNYEFIFIDVGKNGRISDGGIIEYTHFYERLNSKQLHLPENNENVNNLNFVFLGDEAFALKENLLKPYPQQDLDHDKRIFNYRLSRGRNVVENTFGILTSSASYSNQYESGQYFLYRMRYMLFT